MPDDGQQDDTQPKNNPTPTPAPQPTTEPKPEPAPVQQDGTDWKAEARKWEARAKDNKTAADELEKIKAAGRSELEKAQHEAQEAAKRSQALQDRTVKAELKSALAGVVGDAEGIVGDLDLRRFVDDSGEIVQDAVTALVDRYKAFTTGEPRNPRPNPAQGSSATPPKTIAEQITAAQQAGDMKEVLRLKSRQLIGDNKS